MGRSATRWEVVIVVRLQRCTFYRTIPIHFIQQGRLKLIRLSLSYIAISFVKNTYKSIDYYDIQQCIRYGEEKFRCILRQPVYNIHDKHANCKANVFSQWKTLSCVIEDTPCGGKMVEYFSTLSFTKQCCLQLFILIWQPPATDLICHTELYVFTKSLN